MKKFIFIIVLLSFFSNILYANDIEIIVQKNHAGGRIKEIRFSPSGDFFVTVGAEENFIWDFARNRQVKHTFDLGQKNNNFLLSENGKYICVNEDRKLVVFDPKTDNTKIVDFGENPNFDFNKFIIVHKKDVSELYDPVTLQKISSDKRLILRKGRGFVFAKKEPLTAVKIDKSTFKIYNYQNWKYQTILKINNDSNYEFYFKDYSFCDDDKKFVSILKHKEKNEYALGIWETDDADIWKRICHVKESKGEALSPNSNLYAVKIKKEISVWDISRAKKIWSIQDNKSRYRDLYFSHQGNILAYETDNGFKLYDFNKKRNVGFIKYSLLKFTFHPSDAYIVIVNSPKIDIFTIDDLKKPMQSFKNIYSKIDLTYIPKYKSIFYSIYYPYIISLDRFSHKILPRIEKIKYWKDDLFVGKQGKKLILFDLVKNKIVKEYKGELINISWFSKKRGLALTTHKLEKDTAYMEYMKRVSESENEMDVKYQEPKVDLVFF